MIWKDLAVKTKNLAVKTKNLAVKTKNLAVKTKNLIKKQLIPNWKKMFFVVQYKMNNLEEVKKAIELISAESQELMKTIQNPLDATLISLKKSVIKINEMSSELQHLGQIIPNNKSRCILVTPYDKLNFKQIEQFISQLNLGVTSSSSSSIILTIPELTQEKISKIKKDTVKQFNTLHEKIRNIRQKFIKALNDPCEDTKNRTKKDLDDFVAKHNKIITNNIKIINP